MTGMVAVHLGAGTHKSKNFKEYNRLARTASKAGVAVLKSGGTPLEAVKAAVAVLENNPLTNSGFGSNLTLQGYVENDASIMDGATLTYGGCGAIDKVKNPIELAYDICVKQSNELPLGLIPPSLIVGAGGVLHARKAGLKIVNKKSLISRKALRQYQKYKGLLDLHEQINFHTLDTVGAVCVDDSGHVASACSSGGLLLKTPGRVGQAALYACGVWADSFSPLTESSVATCTTGCGEHLVQTHLAKEIAIGIQDSTCPTTALHKLITEKFLRSRYLRNVKQKFGGALVLHVSRNKEVSLLWGHTTESISIGYMKTTDEKAKGLISRLPQNTAAGESVNVGGVHFYMKDNYVSSDE